MCAFILDSFIRLNENLQNEGTFVCDVIKSH